MTQPLLSVLIPAYNQPAGVERILARLAGLGAPGELEIRVSDDSTDDAAAARIAAAVQAHASGRGGCTCVYQRNRPPLGAVPNWNALLAQARGRYVWLLHHDEEPDGAATWAPLLAALRRDEADVWVLRCCVRHRPGARPRLHFPPRWTVAVLRRWPGYLLRRNLVGPPSALIVRDYAAVRFDEGLAWLVDVEAYVRLVANSPRLQACPGVGVVSHVDAQNSISASLRPGLAQTVRRERALLLSRVGGQAGRGWLKATASARALRGLELSAWAALRLGLRMAARLRQWC